MKNKSNNITANTLRFSKAMKEMYGAGSSNEHIIKQYENIFSTTNLIQALEENAFVKNKKLSEDVFYIGFVLHLFTDQTTPILCKYITTTWHGRQEDIASLLKERKDPKTLPFLVKAMYQNWNHLYDYGDAFIRKCMFAIASMNTEESNEKLMKLSESENETIKKYAFHQIQKNKV
ncbi:MAG: hypothetical protein KA341_12680 [Saprospiraceae bacterium]|nr:hypothetical protein [Saprospiraceae bacterium]